MDLSRSEARYELDTACDDDDVARVEQLFSSPSLDAEDATSALRESHGIPDLTLLRVLLHNGADVSVVHTRDIPLSERVNELVRLLAEYQYDFKLEGHRILENFARDREMLDWLLDQGVDINRTDSQRLDDGFNLAHGETDDSLHLLNIVAADGDIDLFDHLVSRGANPLLSTALHSASQCEDPDISRAMTCHLLDKHNIDINSDKEDFRDFFHDGSDDTGSPLCSAILHRNLAVIHELLNRGAIPNRPHSCPVHYAVKAGGFLPALEPLLRAGADPVKALEQAAGQLNLDAAKVCLAFAADPAPALHKALEQERDRVQRIAADAAFTASRPDLHYKPSERVLERERATKRASEAMVALLRSAIESGDAARTIDSL